MIEDALKATRNLHRLIIAVSLITLVFAFSLRAPIEKIEQLKAIESLLKFQFTEYDKFAKEQIAKAANTYLAPISSLMEVELGKGGHLVFQLHHIAEAFGRPIHAGRIIAEDTILKMPSNASLNQFNALTAVGFDQDIQLLVPETNKLTSKIHDFLRANPKAGMRIDNIQLNVESASDTGATFVPAIAVRAGIYFELVEEVRTAGAPVFSASFNCRIVSLPSTSFKNWLQDRDDARRLIGESRDGIRWLPGLRDLPTGFTEKKLGLIASGLTEDIKQAGPERRNISLLGATVPGILFVYASPLVLLALTYYFFNHIGHLQELAYANRDEFKAFAWMPLALGVRWVWELAASGVVLPGGATLILYLKLEEIGGLSPFSTVIVLLGGSGTVLLGIASVLRTKIIRERIGRTNQKRR